MFDRSKVLRFFYFSFALIALAVMTGCAHLPGKPTTSEIGSLRAALAGLAPTVRADEASEVAECAYEYPRILAARYRVVRPALFQNFLVNSGFRQRGLCYEWAEDLLAQLRTLHLESLELHWAIARANTAREHNSLVLTAPGQPFQEGIVLDAWRHSGRLAWSPVLKDKYPWVEGELDPTPASAMRK